jgi:zinc protease
VETGASALARPHRVAANVIREVFPNGLTLLVKENHSVPVTALLVSVQAGYFHESDRLNGISHVIEHMVFKGSESRREHEQIAREIREIGGIINAGTYYEETSYYVVVPSEHVGRAMEVQADAFQHPLFDADDLSKEIEVIVQESLQKRDNPNAILIESLYELMFDRHRIRRWRIGHPETLRALTRDDLVQFVGRMYRPENTLVAVVGDVSADRIRTLAADLWSGMPRGEFLTDLSPVEPARHTMRYRRMSGDTRQRLLLMGFPAPTILHPDAAPLMVLSALLSDGRSARLFRTLKEELHLASSAWASYEGFDQMGIFTLGAESVGDDPLPLEIALWREIDRIRQLPVREEELNRIKARIESRRLFAQEDVLGMARTLATYEALGDYHLTDEMLERLHAVTAEDVVSVARRYLQLSQASLIEYLPADGADRPDQSLESVEAALRGVETIHESDAPAIAPTATIATAFSVLTDPSPASDTTETRVIPLENGGLLLFKPRSDLPLVSITALFRGGRRRESRSNSGITNLMLKSAIKGTRRFSADEIASRIEALGSGIGMSLTPDYFGYGVKLRREALIEGFDVFSDVMAFPSFPDDEVEREKQTIYAEIRRQQDNNFSLAYDLFSAACYGEQHPYGLPASGMPEAVSQLGSSDLHAWHGRQVVAQNLVAAVVGDIDEELAVSLFRNLLPVSSEPDAGSWGDSGGACAGQALAERITQRNKQQTAAVLGFPGATLSNDDRYALDLLAEITSGMGGRFFRKVRGENALAYQVTSFHRSRLDTGNFIAYTSTSPESEERARELLLNECETLGRELVSEYEMRTAKAALVGEHVIGTQTFGAQAGELASVGIYGLPPDEPSRYLARIEQVTAEEVREAAGKYLVPDRYWLGIVRGGGETD